MFTAQNLFTILKMLHRNFLPHLTQHPGTFSINKWLCVCVRLYNSWWLMLPSHSRKHFCCFSIVECMWEGCWESPCTLATLNKISLSLSRRLFRLPCYHNWKIFLNFLLSVREETSLIRVVFNSKFIPWFLYFFHSNWVLKFLHPQEDFSSGNCEVQK